MVAGSHCVNDNKPDITPELLDQIKKRNYRQKQYRARRYRNKAHRENAPPTPHIVKGEAENPIGNPEGDNREKQICGVGNKVCRTVIRGGKIPRIKPHHKENQYFRPEGTDAYEESVG